MANLDFYILKKGISSLTRCQFVDTMVKGEGRKMKNKSMSIFSSVNSAVYTLLVTFLAILMLASLGNSNPLSKSVDRWKVPVSESELSALNELDCLEKSLEVIPENSKVNLSSNAGPYWDQRFHDISFPRISVVSETSDFRVYLESAPTPEAQSQCGSLFLGIKSDG